MCFGKAGQDAEKADGADGITYGRSLDEATKVDLIKSHDSHAFADPFIGQ